MQIILHDPLRQLWASCDVFTEVQHLQGAIVREKEGRQTLRFTLAGRTYYRKLHRGIGWREIFKNLLQAKLPVIGASNEWRALNRLQAVGVDTLSPVGYGKRGFNPASQLSFLITDELADTVSLAVFTQNWRNEAPPFVLKRALIVKVAEVTKAMHGQGINHRDLYICHFLLDKASISAAIPRLYLVDLHRAQMRTFVPKRWRVKDLASIYFSALDIGLTARDVLRFLRAYYGVSLRCLLHREKSVLSRVRERAIKLYRRDFKRLPRLPL